MSEKVRFGLLGAANIAQKAHVPAFASSEDAVLLGIASRDRKKAGAWGEAFGIPRVYASYEEMLADPEIDCILNALVHIHHAEWTIKALEAGKHVLCEKPLAPSLAEVEAMQSAAAKNGVFLMEAFHHRFSPQFDFVDQIIDQGEIGEIKTIRTELTYPVSDWENDSRANPDLGAGVLLEAGCYCVNTIRHFMRSEPIEVNASASIHQPGNFESTLAGVLKFPGERVALLHTSMELPFTANCELIGTHGRIRMPELFDGSRIEIEREDRSRVQPFPVINRFTTQIDHFAHCIRSGTSPRISGEDSIGNIRVMERLLQSAGVC